MKKSKFLSQRPAHVFPFAKMPHEVCVSKYDANMDFLLNKITNALKGKEIPKTGKELNAITCDADNFDCMKKLCETSKENSFFSFFEDLDKPAVLRQWNNENGFLKISEKNVIICQLADEVDVKLTTSKNMSLCSVLMFKNVKII